MWTRGLITYDGAKVSGYVIEAELPSSYQGFGDREIIDAPAPCVAGD
jgi:hypothetical protein